MNHHNIFFCIATHIGFEYQSYEVTEPNPDDENLKSCVFNQRR